MKCDVCHKNLDPSDAYEDSAGIELRIHKACMDNATYIDLEIPDYQEPTGGVTMLQPDYARPDYGRPARKADDPRAIGVPQAKCVLCGQPASQVEKYKLSDGRTVYAHALCLAIEQLKYGKNSNESGQQSAMKAQSREYLPMSKTYGSLMAREAIERRSTNQTAWEAAQQAHADMIARHGDAMRAAGIISKHFSSSDRSE